MLHRAFRHPAARVLLLAGTVVATVATSRPPFDWQLDAETPLEHLVLRPGESIERSVRAESNVKEEVTRKFRFEPAVKDGRFDLEVADEDQVGGTTTHLGSDGLWVLSGAPAYTRRLPHVEVLLPSRSAGTATTRFKLTNRGSSPLDFTWKATIGSGGYDDRPAEAFVKIERIP